MSSVFVFAYGSNMCLERMRHRVASAEVVTTGFVTGRRLAFHKRSIDGSSKADAPGTRDSTDRVWGVVYSLDPNDKIVLDGHEFLGIGYDQCEVRVRASHRSLCAWMYIAREEAIDASLLPYTWYHNFLIRGADQHQLPGHYIDYLKAFPAQRDPDTARDLRNQVILGGS